MGAEGVETRRFLDEFVKEFPEPLGPEDPLPLSPLSGKVSPEEVRGESLDLALRLLAARNAPPLLAAALSHTALSELLKSDLTPFHLPVEPEQDVTLLQSDGLQKLFFNKLREVAFTWQKKPPAPPPAPPRPLLTSIHAIRNARRKMEDRHVALSEFNQLFGIQDEVRRGYFAVFDGHGGVDAATYAATHLHTVLGYHDDLTGDPAAALKSAFKRTDDIVCAVAVRAWQYCWMVIGCVWPGWDEKRRIEDLGGCIAFMGCWRVNGTYAVSRAIGDFDQKPYISSEADCSSVHLTGEEDYVLLACDGFFDTVRVADVPGLVQEALREGEGAIGDVAAATAQRLVAQAKSAGSSDNITVLLVFLRDPEQLRQEAKRQGAAPPVCGSHQEAPQAQQGPFDQ
ncbi:hypothetical protein JZ751_009243 [Albula glossodonta]|uniref:PPM-type phosphatase domain-containing protein n=1 Tax=Albula glossodonta TaxID=121402 RepID=A0A8T2N614_9TELE|nr:hypothetical protein JZ751_009243 [Albula glossodonta]